MKPRSSHVKVRSLYSLLDVDWLIDPGYGQTMPAGHEVRTCWMPTPARAPVVPSWPDRLKRMNLLLLAPSMTNIWPPAGPLHTKVVVSGASPTSITELRLTR